MPTERAASNKGREKRIGRLCRSSSASPEAGCYHVGMIGPLETPRLVLRPLELADAEQTQRLFPHWEVVRFLANRVPWPYPDDGALTYYRDDALPAMARGDE